MTLTDRIIGRHIATMRRTLDIIDHLLAVTPPDHLTRFTDGPDGWSGVQIIGHLHDADEVFSRRVHAILSTDRPALEVFPHEQMVSERGYQQQDPAAVFALLKPSRAAMVELFKALSPDQWERAGVHPEYGDWLVLDSLMQVGHHDITHLEQLTRVLTQAVSGRSDG